MKIIKNVKYQETRRGIAFEAKTDFGIIWNGGMGGATHFTPKNKDLCSQTKELMSKDEDALNELISEWEISKGYI